MMWRRWAAWIGGALSALMLLSIPAQSEATPLYTARGGRTCDNCHSLPNTWYDPPETWRRKCTMSCASCHVDPNGGGLRNTSGRYYSMSTLPMFLATDRPLDDQTEAEVKAWLKANGRDGKPDSEPASGRYVAGEPAEPGSEPTSGEYRPAERPEDPRPPGSPQPDGGPVFGRPLGHGHSEMAWLDGRYGHLNADPLLQLGGDFRLGFWSQGPLFFPMQGDFHTALHPVEYLTLSTTVGLRGRTKGFRATQDEDPSVMARDLWVMVHELPALSYLRVGRFLPAFGWRVEDHTAYTRRPFGVSQEDPTNRVVGAEIGFTGNYPYFNAAAFAPSQREGTLDPFATDPGWGAAVNGGWRDMGWSLGASAMIRRRPLDNDFGGDTLDLSLQGSYNLWYYSKSLPVTWIGEVATGTLQRPFSGSETRQFATYQALAWTVYRGLVVQGRYDFWDPDSAIREDEIHRPGVTAEWIMLPGLSLRTDVRLGLPTAPGAEPSADLFAQIHGWF